MLRPRLLALAATFLTLQASCLLAAVNSWYDFAHDHVLGTSLDLHFQAATPAAAARAEAAALAEIDRLAAILSGYDASSEFSRWTATRDQPVAVSADLFAVLGLYDTWRTETAGTLEAATEAAAQLWRRAAMRGSAPTAEELATTVRAMQGRHWQLDAATGTATHLTATPLRLNSFTKGYIIDRAAAAALSAGPLETVVVNIGGDLVIRGGAVQVVTVTDPSAAADNEAPFAALSLSNRAVATSGGYRRGFEVGDRRQSHLIDPRTALPATEVVSATVVARDAVEAGALATALGVLSAEQGKRLAAGRSNVEYLLVLRDGRQIASPGWNSLAAPVPTSAVASRLSAPQLLRVATSTASSAPTVEATVSLQIASPGGRAKRPFVAVWIEDKDGFPVRTLALWFHGNRWLPDLRSWMKADHMRAMTEGTQIAATISSATRGPGNYTLKWDGRDAQGQALPPGDYTLLIEAAREHGTHQVIKHSFSLPTASGHSALPGNEEISAAGVEFRRPGGI
jgi:thiamine biosynthesis lipoprotein ApbE